MRGIGSMLHELSGTKKSSSDYYGRLITGAFADKDKDRLVLQFSDGVKIAITDEAQSCCEHRYMVFDDDVAALVGNKLVAIEVREVENKEDEYSCHEIAFLDIKTSGGMVTVSTHNEHNGYYGGFGLSIDEVTE